MPIHQSESSIDKYGILINKGGTNRASVWRPIQKDCGNVEKVLTSEEKTYAVLGLLRLGKGAIVLTGMALTSSSEFDKLALFLEALLIKRRGEDIKNE